MRRSRGSRAFHPGGAAGRCLGTPVLVTLGVLRESRRWGQGRCSTPAQHPGHPDKEWPSSECPRCCRQESHNLICPAAPSNCSKCLAPYPNQPSLAKVGWSVASSSHAAPRALTAVGTRVCTAAWPKSKSHGTRANGGPHRTLLCLNSFIPGLSIYSCLHLDQSPPHQQEPSAGPGPALKPQAAIPSEATRGHQVLGPLPTALQDSHLPGVKPSPPLDSLGRARPALPPFPTPTAHSALLFL